MQSTNGSPTPCAACRRRSLLKAPRSVSSWRCRRSTGSSVTYSWHWAFGALGIVGLLWCVLWMIYGREGTLVDPPVSGTGTNESIPYRYLLTCPSILAACCAGFASYWAWCARPYLIHLVPRRRARLQPEGRRQSDHPAVDFRPHRRDGRRLGLAAPQDPGRVELALPRGLRGRDRHSGRLRDALYRAGRLARSQDRAAGVRRGVRAARSTSSSP